METTTEKTSLTAADQAALGKYANLAFRAHAAGVARREAMELRRDVADQLQHAQRFIAELIRTEAMKPASSLIAGMSSADVSRIDREALNTFIANASSASHATLARNIERAVRTADVLKLRVRLLDDEVARMQGIVGPAFENATAVRKYLISAGIISNEDWN